MKIIKLMSMIMILSIMLASCKKPFEDLVIGDPYSQVEGIEGVWKLSNFAQVDELSFEKTRIDLSATLSDAVIEITFNSQDKTYSINRTGGPDLFGTGGQWSFDDDQFPTKINFTSGTENFTVNLGSPVRKFDENLVLRLNKSCDNTLLLSYRFTFTRQ